MAGDQARVRSTSAPSAAPVQAEPAAGDASADVKAAEQATPNQWRSWSNLWQVPALILGGTLIGYGLHHASGKAEPEDLVAELERVEQFIAAGEYKSAASIIKEKLEPRIEEAPAAARSRYHVNVADLVFLSQQAEGLSDPQNFQQIDEHYASAMRLGGAVEPRQAERWADSLLAIDDLDGVRARLSEFDALKPEQLPQEQVEEVRLIRNRVFRQWVEAALRHGESSYQQLSEMLAEYRQNRDLPIADELWAVARQAQIRLESGMAQQAVDFLLVEMRRLEGRGAPGHPLNVAELYGLLGRGYFELGDYERAHKLLEHAVGAFGSQEQAMGEALVLLGQIAATRGQPDVALEKFEIAARDFPATPSYLPALLGLAEMHSVLGEHGISLEHFKELQAQLQRTGGRDLSPQQIAESLCDRHDAALAMGKLEIAQEYALIGEQFFGPDQVPSDVLFRIASTSRQIAENLVMKAAGRQDEDSFKTAHLDPGVRLECNRLFELSGDYFIRHSNAERSSTATEDQWATSLWMAADSFDRAGRVDLAIKYFLNYLDRRPSDDPRRAETLFRLAQAHHAQLDYERAIGYYEQVVADRARSTFAAQSYVPLARCLVAVNRRPEAVAQLRQVLSGDRLLKPDARDYRDALIELGRIHYQAGDFIAAVEQFKEAIERYADDPNRIEIVFLLADSYRGNAMSIVQRLSESPVISPSEQTRLKSLRNSHLETARELFAAVCEEYPQLPAGALGAYELDQLRRARLYRGDCAFYLGQYEQAIELYDQVTRQYSAHHSAMYALIQIVNCYREMGDDAKSEAAHRRALARLNQLPDTAFSAPDALMDRKAWERWLENVPLNPTQTAAAEPTSP